MDVSAAELKQIIIDHWGVEIERSYLEKLLAIMPVNEKLACVIDSQGNAAQPFKGYVFCTSNQLILIGKGKEKILPISLIKNISLSKGVAFTVDESELVIQTGMETIVISSSRHNMLNNLYQIVLNKTGQTGAVASQVVQKNKEGAILKTIIGVVVVIAVFYLLYSINWEYIGSLR